MVADDIQGTFDSLDGAVIVEDGEPTYVGSNGQGEDGMFRYVLSTDTTLTLVSYFAVPGDANGDGFVDTSDFNIWNANRFTLGTDWTSGDFNGDGLTDTADFNLWNRNRFTSVPLPAAAVPEPSSWGGCSWV